MKLLNCPCQDQHRYSLLLQSNFSQNGIARCWGESPSPARKNRRFATVRYTFTFIERETFVIFHLKISEIHFTDMIGCFADPPPQLSLRRSPEHPSVIQTRFFLYTRADPQNPQPIQYGDDLKSILHSQFNATKHLKVLIHGFKGSGSDTGMMLAINSLCDIVIICFYTIISVENSVENFEKSWSLKLFVTLS